LETIGWVILTFLVGNKILTDLRSGNSKFVMQLMNHETITINGDGNYSRDFTYIENVIQMNELAMTTEIQLR
jgi:nucleoside-diphosphate-sugar epimerase